MEEKTQKGYKNLSDIPETIWKELSNKKLFFAHQSVGKNILNGVKDLKIKYPAISFNVVEVEPETQLGRGTLAHAKLGWNENPVSKVEDFQNMMDEGIGRQVDVAFMKFCYVDFHRNSDVKPLFDEYKTMIEEVKNKYPDVKIFHMTVPLLAVQTGPKAWVKKILGKPLDGTVDNMKRLEFSDMILNQYKGIDPIFDIADAESTYPDGKRKYFSLDGKTGYALVPSYTDDGGHLNAEGRKVVAEKFLLFLINNCL